jgi:hypothetical protein
VPIHKRDLSSEAEQGGTRPKRRDLVDKRRASWSDGETVTDPCLSQDVTRAVRVLLDLLTQLAHVDAQVLHVDLGTPNLFHNRAVGKLDLLRKSGEFPNEL